MNQEHHPKDVSRYALQGIYRQTCGPVFRHLLGIDRAMVAHHKPKNLKDLVIQIRMKDCNEFDLKASTYDEKQTGRVMGIAGKDAVREMVSDDKVSGDMRERLHKTFNLVG